MVIFGLIGAPKAGKDTVAQFFVHRGYKQLAFADKIKEEYYKISGFTEEQFKSNRGSPIEAQIREGLWDYSAEMKAAYGSDHFIGPVIDEIKESTENIVVSDVRTLCELRALAKLGTHFLLVTKDARKDMVGDVVPGTQIPPEYIEDYCYIFVNNYNTVEEAWIALEDTLKGAKIMDPDDYYHER